MKDVSLQTVIYTERLLTSLTKHNRCDTTVYLHNQPHPPKKKTKQRKVKKKNKHSTWLNTDKLLKLRLK